MIGSIRKLLDTIEEHRVKDLDDGSKNMEGSLAGGSNILGGAKDQAFDFDSIEKSLGVKRDEQASGANNGS